MPDIPPARLAELPPHRWEEVKSWFRSVDRFLEQEDRSTAMIRRHAAELGVSKSMFYKLLNTRERWFDANGPMRPPPRRRPLDPAAAAIVEEAMALSGPGAIQERVYECAARIAAHRGMDRPGRGAVRAVHNRTRAGGATGERLATSAAAIIDASPLAVRTIGGYGHVLAVLTAVIDGSGDVVDWVLTAGSADFEVVAALVARARDRFGADAIIASRALGGELRDTLDITDVNGSTGRAIRGGAAILAALGKKIGRISLIPWTCPGDPTDEHPLVEIADAQAVMELFLPLKRTGSDTRG